MKRTRERSTKKQVDFNTLEIYGDRQNIARIYRIFTSLILLGFSAGFFILLSNENWWQITVVSAAVPLILLCFYWIAKNKFELVSIFLAITLFTLITIMSTSGQGIHAITNLGFPAVLILASLVIRKRTLVLLIVYAAACVAWLVFGELLNLYTPNPITSSVPGDFFTVLLVLIGTAIMVRFLTETLFRSHQQVQKELSERKRAEERLTYDALHDALTNLPNRTLFLDRLNQRLEHARRHTANLFAVIYIDLDRIKVVNDSLGHAVGDQFLIKTAQRLTECLRPEDTVARLGGDEFAILLDDFKENRNAIQVAERIQSELSSTPLIEGIDRVTTASIGITIYTERYTDPTELLRDADIAMYRAKAKGGGQYALFDDTMHTHAMTLLQLEADLKHAVENNEWRVYYQPIVNLPDRKITGLEALVRWQHPKRGLVKPAKFIHAAEETGLILPMGEYVLRQACQQVKIWRQKQPELIVSVNLSGRQFQEEGLVSTIKTILEETGLPGTALQLEITESIAMSDLEFSARVLGQLDRLGIQIALDDFGHGYSSLGYLNQFPVRILKIDRSFIKDIRRKKSSETITRAILSLGHALNMQVVAEGVETKEQFDFLHSNFCDRVQGHLVSRAVPAAKLEKLL